MPDKPEQGVRERIEGILTNGHNNKVHIEQLLDLIRTEREKDEDMLQIAWGIIANVSGGDWTKQPKEWQEAAAKWRDKWLLSIKKG